MAVPLGVNRSFSRTPGRSPDASGSSNQGPAREEMKSELFTPSAARLPTSRKRFHFGNHFKDLRSRQRLRPWPRSERRRLSSGRPPGCQPALSGLPPIPGELRIFWRNPCPRKPGSQAFPYPRGGGGQRLGSLRLRLHFQGLTSRLALPSPPRSERRRLSIGAAGRRQQACAKNLADRRNAAPSHLGKRLDPQ